MDQAGDAIRTTGRKGLPYLDGIEFDIIKNRATAVLAFVAGKVDVTFPTELTEQLIEDIKKQDPTAICEIEPINVSTNLIINREKPPFDNAELRKAMALSLDRQAFIDIILQGTATRAARCCRRRKASGACRRTCSRPSPATAT